MHDRPTSKQLRQSMPPAPQLSVTVPGWQIPLATHPGQHAPFTQRPPVQAVRSAFFTVPQTPLVQVAVLQAGAAGQVRQVAPAVPQYVMLFPDIQPDPLMQPLQQLPEAQLPVEQGVPVVWYEASQ